MTEQSIHDLGRSSKEIFDSRVQEMRFLVTQSCNYDCTFCHGEGLQSKKNDLMTPEDYRFLFRVGKQYFKMMSATLTGGEPLFRRDIVKIANYLYDEGASLTVTTNGALLSKRLEIGEFSTKINISLHSLDKNKYEGTVNRNGVFEKVKLGLKQFKDLFPQNRLVLNAAVIRDFNFNEVDFNNFIQFAQKMDASIKFIELFPSNAQGHVPLEQVKDKIVGLGFHESANFPRKINLTNNQIIISLTRILCAQAMKSDNPGQFCNQNNDLFISPDGKIKPCRNNHQEVDMLDDIRARNEEQVRIKIQLGLDLLGQECIY